MKLYYLNIFDNVVQLHSYQRSLLAPVIQVFFYINELFKPSLIAKSFSLLIMKICRCFLSLKDFTTTLHDLCIAVLSILLNM